MNYNEFKNTVKEQVREYLPAQYQDADIRLEQVTKTNGRVLDGVIIKTGDSNITPSIYLNDFYTEFEDGRDMESILDEIAAIWMDTHVTKDFDVTRITDFDLAKDHIVCSLVNMEKNAEWLSDKPYTQVEDLAAVYRIMLKDGATVISNEMLEGYGITVGELHETALANMERDSHAVFMSLDNVIKETLAPEVMSGLGVGKEEAMEVLEGISLPDTEREFCLTNNVLQYGAAEILRPDIQEMIAGKLGGDYYVLPSSVHEVLVKRVSEEMGYKELESMVQDINAAVLAPEDWLSDHVYMYDAEAKELMRADKAEERKKQREGKEERREWKGSLKDRLAEKKEEAAESNKGHEKTAGRQTELA